MSTKTTLKRVALVAVAAMGLGLLSVAPSSATSQADTLTLSATTSSVVVGTAATTTLTQAFTGLLGDTLTVTASIVSAPTGNSTVPALTTNQANNSNASTVISGGGLIGTTADTASSTVYNAASGVYTVTLPSTAIVGTYVIKFTPAVTGGGGTVSTTTPTWTVTVTAAAAATADSTSTVYIASGTTAPTSTTDAVAINAAMAAGTEVANILVTPKSSSVSSSVPLTATITGPGLIGLGSSNTTAASGRSLTTGTTSVTSDYVTVWSDGTAGVATITISSGSTVLGTKTVNFYGTLASYTATPVKTVIGVGSTDTVAITAKDAAGITAPVGTYYATSATPAVATVAVSGTNVIVTGVAVGTSVITIGNAATSPTISTTFTVTVGKATIGKLTMTTDKASYAAGEKVTLTLTAKGSDGTAVGDGTYATTFSSAGVTSNIAVTGTLPGASVTFTGGVATYTFYAPVVDGTVTLSGTEGASTDATTKPTDTVSFDVANAGSSAAVDAANAATDAANYAADAADAATTAAQEATAAAQAAQDSADAATAAVVALGLRVDTLMASVRAQLTSLSNLLVRLIKKAHA